LARKSAIAIVSFLRRSGETMLSDEYMSCYEWVNDERLASHHAERHVIMQSGECARPARVHNSSLGRMCTLIAN